MLKRSSTEAEVVKALQDLAHEGFSNSSTLDIIAEDSVVPGFKPDFRLLSHQVVARYWMKHNETGFVKGGILADDMGLGKTIQMLVRIVEGTPSKTHLQTSSGGGTLIICPVDLIPQWKAEITKFAPTLKTVCHHGQSRTTDFEQLRKADVVITSFATTASEYTNHVKRSRQTVQARKCKSAVFEVNWWRIVLDEAHNIKNHASKSADACCALDASSRWCLMGTPVQNSLDDLYSLLKFLRKGPLNEWSTFQERVSRPAEAGDLDTAMKPLHAVLRTVMLRRRLDHRMNDQPIVQLPDRRMQVVKCQFDAMEQKFYSALELHVESEIDSIVQRAIVQKSFMSMLTFLLRLRQACDHPHLMFMGVDTSEGSSGESVDSLSDDGSIADPLHHMKSLDPTVHSTPDMPVSSAKIREIVRILHDIKERSSGLDKTIIFCYFTGMMDLIEPVLRQQHVKYMRYDGSMSTEERVKQLAKLNNDPSVVCALISIKAGGTGLNLTSCNNIILVDLWWNPSVEEQAFGRVHRIGQKKTVNIYKLTIPCTIEERILELQQTKQTLSKAALDKEQIAKMKLGLDDLMRLFRVRSRV
ncbi:hypothetical protein DENSPDRAFT_767484 [Dentipellis sp. KUC8613]|nr:hypothetical protein DENSPDRAFT_767484 [Dentipellis sp. KUC8613]